MQLVVYGNNALENFRRLKELYEEQSKIVLSPQIEWSEKDGGKEHHVNYFILNMDPLDKTNWLVQHKLLKEWVEKFLFFFRDKIREL